MNGAGDPAFVDLTIYGTSTGTSRCSFSSSSSSERGLRCPESSATCWRELSKLTSMHTALRCGVRLATSHSRSVGPVSAAKFDIVVQLVDKQAPEHFGMQIDGKGGVGFTKGTATIDLREQDGATVMDYASNVQVGGKIAAVGQRLLESVGKMMMKQALDALEREIRTRLT